MFNDKYSLTQAVLDGRKTMTRRICKYDRPDESWDIVFPVFESKDYDSEGNLISSLYGAFGWKNKDGDFTGWNNPLYKVGEVVAIAQSYMDVDRFHRKGKNAAYLEYLDSILPELKLYPGWGNKMFVKADLMPHHIEITEIKIERLQDISDGDCLKEGIIHASTFLGQKIYHTPHVNGAYLSTNVAQEAFAFLIDKVSGKGTWESNPFVFAYEFKLVD
uniref:ASCH domain protein n=1 Tax=Siphoviridae sp. cttma3 TaxID=2825708 RepID=A0A8S5V8N9_9CAUD|nr:MAG TPA: ASCH domain protein [Siphoviridae sp. cttma3]